MQQIRHWYILSRIDYSQVYITLYVAYSAWYGSALGERSDRAAIERLKRRSVLWEECLAGHCAPRLKIVMRSIYTHTQLKPHFVRASWSGSLQSPVDWRGVIEYWYAVRCAVVHGIQVPEIDARLAYESLLEFMGELLRRSAARGNAVTVDMSRFYDINTLY